MRIISGRAGSRSIAVPSSVARPSTDRLREALFSILGERLVGARVLDLFSGSGALGLESLSRGAHSCHFIDDSRESAAVIRKNLKSLKLENGKIVHQDVFRFLNGVAQDSYDIVFADPPYFKNLSDHDYVADILAHEKLPSALAANALLVIEAPKRNKSENTNGWELLDSRSYGGCGILFYRRRV